MARLPVSRKGTSWVPAKTTSASDTNARLSRLVAADHSQAHEHGWTELLTISLGRHAEFARSSRTITSTTSATNRAGRSGQSLHVCAPLFEDPTVSISHPTESPPRITVDPPHTTPLRPLTWAQLNRDVRRPHRGFPCRLGSSQPPLLSTSQDHPLLPIPAHRRNTRDAVSWLRCLGRPVVSRHYSHVLVCAPPVPRCTVHVMPCRTSWTLRSTAVGTLRGRSGRVAYARPSQRRRARAVRSAGVSQ